MTMVPDVREWVGRARLALDEMKLARVEADPPPPMVTPDQEDRARETRGKDYPSAQRLVAATAVRGFSPLSPLSPVGSMCTGSGDRVRARSG
jgi:hypothetical protein